MRTLQQLATQALEERDLSVLVHTFSKVALEELRWHMPLEQVPNHPIVRLHVSKLATLLNVAVFDAGNSALIRECAASAEFKSGHFINTVNFLGSYKMTCGLDTPAWASCEVTKGIVRELLILCGANTLEAYSLAVAECSRLAGT